MSTNSHPPDPGDPWLKALHERGLVPGARFLLEVSAPLAPLLASLLWVLQPIAGIVGQHKALGHIAEALETPQGLRDLQEKLQRLEDAERESHE